EQVMIAIGLPLLVAGAIGYFSWKILNELGPDEALPTFMHRPGGVWTTIRQVEDGIRTEEAVAAREPQVRQQLESLEGEIALAEQRLPLEAEKTVVRQLIEDLARNIPETMG